MPGEGRDSIGTSHRPVGQSRLVTSASMEDADGSRWSPSPAPRVAVVHERFTEYGGSERVVEQLMRIWPGARLWAPVADPGLLSDHFPGLDVQTGPLQRIYAGGRSYQYLLPLMPAAMGRADFSGCDAVVTSHHAFANRVRVPRGVAMVSYTHTPARWIWEESLRRADTTSPFGRAILGSFAATQRRSDRRSAQRPDLIIANSAYVADRISRWWGRSSEVVHPPVDVDFFTPDPGVDRQDFFLLAGRIVPYKRPEVALAAARRAGVRLVVAGAGRREDRLARLAGRGIELLGAVSAEQLRHLYRSCRALVFPGTEDFGMVPVEAQACGAPVIGRAEGGLLETVVDGRTGVLYRAGPDGGVDPLADAMRSFVDGSFDPAVVRRQAEGFSASRFRSQMSALVSQVITGGPAAT